jgi:hypothetical protein
MVVGIPQGEYVSAAHMSVILKKVRSRRNNNKLLLNDCDFFVYLCSCLKNIVHSGHRVICGTNGKLEVSADKGEHY